MWFDIEARWLCVDTQCLRVVQVGLQCCVRHHTLCSDPSFAQSICKCSCSFIERWWEVAKGQNEKLVVVSSQKKKFWGKEGQTQTCPCTHEPHNHIFIPVRVANDVDNGVTGSDQH